MPRDQREAIEKAKKFAHNAFVAAMEEIARDTQRKMVNMRSNLAKSGQISSGAMINETARIEGDRL